MYPRLEIGTVSPPVSNLFKPHLYKPIYLDAALTAGRHSDLLSWIVHQSIEISYGKGFSLCTYGLTSCSGSLEKKRWIVALYATSNNCIRNQYVFGAVPVQHQRF